MILRREGLYSSRIIEWRKAAAAGAASGLGRKDRDRRDREIEQLRARTEKAEAELAQTRAALDLVGSTRALGDASREHGHTEAVAAVINPAVAELAALTGVKQACALLGRPRASHYRTHQPRVHGPVPAPAPAGPRRGR